ncbi:MAG: hypothetical protein KBS36_02395 [Bacteroidales bacterium]|nr:hypothetical protein [Candidatus Cryptobacteroides fimicaballi]
MKRTISIAFAAFALLSFTSCQKENLVSGNQEPSQRIVTAVFENDDTKTTLGTNDIPLWAEGDKICILASNDSVVIELQESNITENGRKVTFTLTKGLSGTLYAVYPASATTMTSCTDGNITFTIPELQDGTFGSANICVAKGDDKENLVFRNATAVLEITTADDVVGVDITAANNIAGSVTASFNGDEISLTPVLTGKSVSVVCKSAPSDNVFYLAAAPVSTGSTTATCYTIDKRGSAVKESKELKRNVIYSMNLSSMTINTDCDLTGTKGTLNGHECVIIKAKYDGTNDSYLKWATRNIGATADTGTDSYGTYFAWGETTGHSLKSNIAISYPSVSNAFDDGHVFTKTPTLNPEDPAVLPLSYDAAFRNWGTGWRMPTGYISSTVPGEFMALKDATYWKWDDTDKGYYVYAPQEGDKGKKNGETSNTYYKSAALLFFPAAGNGNGNALDSADSNGTYWSSSLRYDYTPHAYNLYFDKGTVNPQGFRSRWNGLPVRPVSD